jgi:hypothetical protein
MFKNPIKVGHLKVQTQELLSSFVDNLIQTYGIDTNSTRELKIPSLKPSTHVYEVLKPELTTTATYIIETKATNEVISHPSLVGSHLLEKCVAGAGELVRAMACLTELYRLDPKDIIYLKVLRAGPYYGRQIAYSLIRNLDLRTVEARVRYTTPSKGEHADKKAEIKEASTDFSELESGRLFYAMADDTGASGKTWEKFIPRCVEEIRKVGSDVRKLDVYGFQSVVALEKLKELEKKLDIKIIAFCIGGIAGIDDRLYDIPLYGPKVRGLHGRGSTVDRSTITRLLQTYPPILDLDAVGGDFSARFLDIETHLRQTIDRVNERLNGNSYEEWQNQVAKEELKRLEDALSKYEK